MLFASFIANERSEPKGENREAAAAQSRMRIELQAKKISSDSEKNNET